MAFAYRGVPFFRGTNPETFSSLRALMRALTHFDAYFSYNFLPLAACFLETTLPALFFVRSLLVRPPTVFSFLPLSTSTFENLPFAILLTRFIAFIAFIAFMAFMAFMAFIA